MACLAFLDRVAELHLRYERATVRQGLDGRDTGVNAAGGINGHPIELEFADTTSGESEVVNHLRRLATQAEVIAVVGPSSSGEVLGVANGEFQLEQGY